MNDDPKRLRAMLQEKIKRVLADTSSQSPQARNKPGLFKQYEIANAAQVFINYCRAEPALKNGRTLALAEAALAALERELGILGVPTSE